MNESGGQAAEKSKVFEEETIAKEGRQEESARAERLQQLAKMRHDPAAIRELFVSGDYPYHSKMPGREYEAKKQALQVELLKVQQWVKDSGQKIVVLFEGRDAAGKGGTIKRFMENILIHAVHVWWLWKSPPIRSVGNGTF